MELMNVPRSQWTGYTGGMAQNQMHVWTNVWDRQDLFIHASFVGNTAAGFLSRGYEFYSNLSKIYQVEYPQSTFFFEVSFDGVHKVQLPYENFIVELSFIIDVNDYHD
jgi:hypothetical protein